MHTSLIIEIILTVVGGLGIFLLGMKNMSEGMQAVAGDGLRRMISKVTNHRLIACAVGVMITCVVQSSSVTTVMVVGLVNSSFMTLRQAVGVIMGANIGTTITGWILVLKIGKYGLPILGIAALFFLFSRRERGRYIAMAIMGVGMVFFGLELMSSGFKPLRGLPEFKAWFTLFTANDYLGVLKCAAVGCLLTMIVQSSSATLGITIGLAEAGIIPFPTAAALVLGENIGTTITALLAAIGATRNAKRAAVFHMLFNVIGVFWITLLFAQYMRLIGGVLAVPPGMEVMVDGEPTYPHIRAGIALVHSGFNIANTLIFLPFLPWMVRIVTRLVPDRGTDEIPHLTFLDVRMLDTPSIGIQQSKDEIERMSEGTEKMMTWLRTCLSDPAHDVALEGKIFHREEIFDNVQNEIMEFLSRMLSGTVPHHIMIEGRKQLRVSDEYESISDYVAALLKLQLRMKNAGLALTDEAKVELLDVHDRVAAYLVRINEAVRSDDDDILAWANSQGDAVTHVIKQCRDRHQGRLETGKESPQMSLIYADMLTAYRKIRGHALNIAETIAKEL
ncbi:MAG: Na/Pi cotransporter family protein [Verrucomicrobia bacterium]|nr:Na/Pi cotransporter family protein [Verrucomicrobiota bacterium]